MPEVRQYADLMVEELRKVIPSFLKRLDVPDRGVAWTDYLASTKSATHDLVASLSVTEDSRDNESVTLTDFDPQGESRIIEAIITANSTLSADAARRAVDQMTASERDHLLATYVGERGNRRHRPGRAFEATDYRFELVTDYGAFRDLQRHRLLTVEWQPLTVELGYDVPDVIVDAGLREPYEESLGRSATLYEEIRSDFPDQAQYTVALAFRIRYTMQMNAREAMHLIELRSGPQGHPSYRRVAHEMVRQIADVAGHHGVARAMRFVDFSDVDLERLNAERAAERNRQNRSR